MAILDDLVSNMVLTADDLACLQKKRGFTPEVIDMYRLRSCGPHVAGVVEQLQKTYTTGELNEAKILVQNPRDRASYIINPQLLEPRVLIPYLTGAGTVKKVRPHQRGFAGDPHQVFFTKSSFTDGGTCIIAESEFKAIAAEVYHHMAIGIPGISTMSGANLDYFIDELRKIHTNEFIICFDNEIKWDPKFPNYKKDWRKRYDTIIYAYAMAMKIRYADLNCRIATLPESWMVDGKVDIDSALAAGRSELEFQECITAAKDPEKYMADAPIETVHRNYVKRRLRRYFSKSPIAVKNNQFVMADKDGTERLISNCHIYIKNVYEEMNVVDGVTKEMRRDIVVVDEYGSKVAPASLNADAIVTRKGFMAWLVSRGNFLFYGNDTDVVRVWDYVFDHDDGGTVFMLQQAGYSKTWDMWVFKNVIIKDGKAYEADEDGVFWVGDMGFAIGAPSIETAIPMLKTEGEFDMGQFTRWLGETLDDDIGMAKVLIAWNIASCFVEPLFQKHHCFPLIFFHGVAGKGKTTIVRWLHAMLGVKSSIHSLAGATQVGIARELDYYGSIPVVCDDWRNDRKIRSLIPFFLGVYNRQSGIKGTRRRYGIVQSNIDATLILMGQELLNDEGLESRCIQLTIPGDRKVNRYTEVEAVLDDFSAWGFRLLLRFDELKDVVVKESEEARKMLMAIAGKNVEPRMLFNYATIYGAYKAVMGHDDTDLIDFILKNMKVAKKEQVAMDPLQQFATEFSAGVVSGNITEAMYYFDAGYIYIALKPVCDSIDRYYHRENTNNARLVAKLFSQMPYSELGFFTIAGRSLPGIKLNLFEMEETMRKNFESAQGGKEAWDVNA